MSSSTKKIARFFLLLSSSHDNTNPIIFFRLFRPLLSWALDAMLAVKRTRGGGNEFDVTELEDGDMGRLDSVWVSTEHPAIAACAKTHPGVQVRTVSKLLLFLRRQEK